MSSVLWIIVKTVGVFLVVFTVLHLCDYVAYWNLNRRR